MEGGAVVGFDRNMAGADEDFHLELRYGSEIYPISGTEAEHRTPVTMIGSE